MSGANTNRDTGADTKTSNRYSPEDSFKEEPIVKFMLKKDNATKLKETNSIRQYLEGIV